MDFKLKYLLLHNGYTLFNKAVAVGKARKKTNKDKASIYQL